MCLAILAMIMAYCYYIHIVVWPDISSGDWAHKNRETCLKLSLLLWECNLAEFQHFYPIINKIYMLKAGPIIEYCQKWFDFNSGYFIAYLEQNRSKVHALYYIYKFTGYISLMLVSN